MSNIASWRLRSHDPARELELLRADYQNQPLTDAELHAADLLTQIHQQERHHGPVRLEYSADDQVQMISTDIDVHSDVRVDSFPAAGGRHAEERGYLQGFDGGVTITAAGFSWLNPIRERAGWAALRSPAVDLVSVIGATRRTELRRHLGGYRVLSHHPQHSTLSVDYRWLVPEVVVREAIESGLIELDGTDVQRTRLADALPDNFRGDSAANHSAASDDDANHDQ